MMKKIFAATAASAVVAGLMLVSTPAMAADPVATVPVAANPRGIAITPDGSEAYVATGSGSLAVVSLRTNTVTATIAVGTSLAGVALTPDASRAYVADAGGNQVVVVNTATESVVSTIAVPDTPYGITSAPDSGRVYVTRRGTNKVTVINTATNTVTGEIDVGLGPTAIAVSPDGSRGVVANDGAGSATVLNLPAGTPAATLAVGGGAYGVTMDPEGVTAYVTSHTAGTVTAIGPGNTVTSTIPVPDGPAAVAASTDGQFLYVTRYNVGSIAQVRLSNGSIVENTPSGAFPVATAVSPDGSRLVTANLTANSVTLTALAPAVETDAATPVLGTEATGRGLVTADSDAVTQTRCYYGTDATVVAAGPLGSADSAPGVPATVAAGSQTAVTCGMTGLSRGTDYYYVVAATDADGTGWMPEPVMFTTRPPKVGPATIVRKKKKLRFSWAPTVSADYYQGRIRSGGSYGAWRTVASPQIVFTGLSRATTYKVQLRAGNDSGPGPRRTVKARTR